MSESDDPKPRKCSNLREYTERFKQQKLTAWQPILTPNWVIFTFLVVAVVFIPIGSYFLVSSNKLFEAIVTYDGSDSEISTTVNPITCSISRNNEGYEQMSAGAPTKFFDSCIIEVEITKDLAPTEELSLWYQLSNFYQNHRRYVGSVSVSQLIDTTSINPVNELASSDLSLTCVPSTSVKSSFQGRILYPCGLIANSFFNDGISLHSVKRGDKEQTYSGGVLENSVDGLDTITLDKSGIAWSTDLDTSFRNPTSTDCSDDINNPGGNLCPSRYYQYQYAWQTYNQFLCYKKKLNTEIPDTNEPIACETFTTVVAKLARSTYGFSEDEWKEYVKKNFGTNLTLKGECAGCPDSAVMVSVGGLPQPDDVTDSTSSGGIRSESLVVWMRIAGLPTFRKVYGKVTPPKGGFLKGDKISFAVQPNFEVKSYNGTKSLVLSTSSPLGSKSNVLGIAYISVGLICLAFALSVFLKSKISPRRLGDPSSLKWRKRD